MTIHGLHHLVLLVDDLPDGETYYRELFDMEVLFREGVRGDKPGTLPPDMDWDEAREAGITPTMAFLGRDDFTLAVAAETASFADGRVDHIALAVDDDSFEAISERAEAAGLEVERTAPHHRLFTDRYGLEWELNARSRPPGRAFETFDV
ncbi:VOC family protein [Haloferax larsenii]|uniref:Catechol 2,3-dioxygenase n=1 Tax=Haloferax larsenii TaxID=302484 RepID=A0A1H7QJR6_HALLR|nr:VOC family protein [Haloferax larsenii]SEL48029.1 Catechol 2,3-dioxygenase [Haloferax larsenii]